MRGFVALFLPQNFSAKACNLIWKCAFVFEVSHLPWKPFFFSLLPPHWFLATTHPIKFFSDSFIRYVSFSSPSINPCRCSPHEGIISKAAFNTYPRLLLKWLYATSEQGWQIYFPPTNLFGNAPVFKATPIDSNFSFQIYFTLNHKSPSFHGEIWSPNSGSLDHVPALLVH